jgi:toxin ParE1/3/4
MNIQFHPLARAELYRVAEWYDVRRLGLGDQFFAEIDVAMAQMRDFPGAQPLIAHDCRRMLLDRFPYSLIYQQAGSETLLIIAVAHNKRRPGYWRRRPVVRRG